MNQQSLITEAQARVTGSEELREFADLLLPDPEDGAAWQFSEASGDDYYSWLADAPTEELLSWCKHVRTEARSLAEHKAWVAAGRESGF